MDDPRLGNWEKLAEARTRRRLIIEKSREEFKSTEFVQRHYYLARGVRFLTDKELSEWHASFARILERRAVKRG